MPDKPTQLADAADHGGTASRLCDLVEMTALLAAAADAQMQQLLIYQRPDGSRYDEADHLRAMVFALNKQATEIRQLTLDLLE